MSQTERLGRLQSFLSGPNYRTREWLLEQFEVSYATLKRDLQYLRDRMGQPVEYCSEHGGYRINTAAARVGQQYELPNLWLSAEEVHALLSIHHLLSNLDAGGLLGNHIEPIMDRLTSMLADGTGKARDLSQRIIVQTVGARRLNLPHFQRIGSALLQRKRLDILYRARTRNEATQRVVSPQRLIHYRDNWYLDAWCHLRQQLRSFSVDVIEKVEVIDEKAIEVHPSEIDATLGAGYGIFGGKDVTWARLRFTPSSARWVAAETWHRDQQGHRDEAGYYHLSLPYSDPTELIMDILRHQPEVEVLAPESLREAVVQRLREGLERMTKQAQEPGER
jgi:predicted DNA-binding transcriptional regulator YafY